MFSGIIETIGEIISLECVNHILQAMICPRIILNDVQIADSIAVNGVCLTVVNKIKNNFLVEIVPETLRCTNLSAIAVGASVNLERSLKIGNRNGGHFVQGHIDAVGEILEIKKEAAALLVEITIPDCLAKYIVNKGFIALDGMSITIINAGNNSFTITFIPYTQQATIVKNYKVGAKVNIEVDVLSKYIEKHMSINNVC